MDSGQDWESKFRAGDTGWERGEINPAFTRWLSRDDFGVGTVFVPGCGRSPELAELARRCRSVGVDIAQTAIDYQTRALDGLNGTAVLGDVLTWMPELEIDAVYEQTCLCAIQPDERGAYERLMSRILRPGGRLFALFMQKDGPGGPPFHCDIKEMRDLFPRSRWSWEAGTPIESPHPKGVRELGYVLVRAG